MRLDKAQRKVAAHLHAFFKGQRVSIEKWPTGPDKRRVPRFAVARVDPGPRVPGLWTYVSLGCWTAAHDGEHGLEFAVAVDNENPRLVELLAMTAYYRCGPPSQRLDLGHTVPIGEPWLPGASCDHLLVSLPYPFGPELEVCNWRGGHARILWLVPITESERDYKTANGQEELEQIFESTEIRYWDPLRSPVA